jgi:hypothetical protein
MLNSMRSRYALGVALAALAGAAPVAAGEVTVAPYIWFEGLDGDGDVDGELYAVDADPLDIDHYDGGGAVSVDARGERWAFLGSLAAVDVDQETVSVGGASDLTAEQTMVEAMVGYRLTRAGLYVIGGVRSLDYDVALRGGSNVQGSADWLDPVVGLWYRADAKRWGVSVAGDIGVGGDSDDTYQIASLFYIHLTRSVSLTLGYKALDMHYEDEASGFRMHTVTKGPLAGVAFRF